MNGNDIRNIITLLENLQVDEAPSLLVWKVNPKATGSWSSFHRRGWPSANYRTDQAAAMITSVDDYEPSKAKTGNHAELRVSIADWTAREKDPSASAFIWRKLKQVFPTLSEAKQGAEKFLNEHPEYRPKELRPGENNG